MKNTQPNYGRKIQLDLMKMAHHGVDYNNTTYFLTSLNPKTVVITGPESWYNDRMKKCMPNTKVYSTVTDSAAVIAEFSTSGMDTKYQKISAMSEKLMVKHIGLMKMVELYLDGNIVMGGIL